MPTYQANEKLLARAPPHAKFKFMNSLRARDVEVTDAIRLEPRSTLCEQAESRLHKRLLGYFTYPRPKTPSAGVAGGYRKQVEDSLKEFTRGSVATGKGRRAMPSSMQNTGIGEATLPHQTKSKPQTSRFRRVLRRLDMALFTLCAILFLDQLTGSAAMGVQSISLWLLTLVFFFIPYGLITAELGSTYTEEGGIYAWVRRAFGPVWAGRTAWLWWVSVAIWLPSVCILFAVIFSDAFALEMDQSTKILMIIALIWLIVGITIVTLDLGKWVPNLGAAFKVIVIIALGLGGIVYAWKHGAANGFITVSDLIPSLNSTLYFYPIIVYNFLGFELMSGAGEEMKNPARDVSFAIVRSGALIAFFYLVATIGMLLVVPAEYFNSNLTLGLPNTFRCMLGTIDNLVWTTGSGTIDDPTLIHTYTCLVGKPGDNALVIALCVMLLYSLVANMVTWSMGANRSAAEAANRGDLPSLFAKLHSTYRTPAHSAVLTGVISTGVLVGFLVHQGFLESDFDWNHFKTNFSTLFWITFAFSVVVFLLPYLLLFASFLKLRLADPNTPRPYRVPGGYPTAILLTIVCILFILVAIGLLLFPGVNEGIDKIDMDQAKFIGAWLLATVGAGEVLVRFAQWRWRALANV